MYNYILLNYAVLSDENQKRSFCLSFVPRVNVKFPFSNMGRTTLRTKQFYGVMLHKRNISYFRGDIIEFTTPVLECDESLTEAMGRVIYLVSVHCFLFLFGSGWI